MDNWVGESGKMAMWGKRGLCIDRVKELSKLMREAGEDFEIRVGTRMKEPHCWIQYKGEILDPSHIDTNPELYYDVNWLTYKEIQGMKSTPGARYWWRT